MTTNLPLTILTAVVTLGAIDVVYFHLYRFRLWAQPGSVAEEVTHLIRHVVFLAVLALLASGVQTAVADRAVLVLIVIDLLNSAADVLLERRSREPLGGLPATEYLIHVLSSFGLGIAVMAYLFARPQLPLPRPEGLLAWQVGAMLVAGGVLFCVEAALFASALLKRRATFWPRLAASA